MLINLRIPVDNIYTRILFATDLGPQSLYIGQHALKISKLCKAECVVLHVIEPPVTYTADFAEREKLVKKVQTAAQKSLGALGAQLGIVSSEQLIRVGLPQEEILAYSIKHQCDLIVVGSHGIGGYTHSLGSTAHHLTGEAHCDVLIVQVSHLQKEIEANPPSGLYLWQAPMDDKPKAPSVSKGSKWGGSEKGFGDEVRRGPRPGIRPPGTPYKGGTRKRTSEENDSDENTDK